VKAGTLYQALMNAQVGNPRLADLGFSYSLTAMRENRPMLTKLFDVLGATLAQAHKFEASFAGLLDDQDLWATAVGFFKAGALRMPFPVCYFEFSRVSQVRHDKLLAALVLESGPYDLELYPFEYEPPGPWIHYGTMVQIGRMLDPPEQLMLLDEDGLADRDMVVTNSERALQYSLTLALFLSTKHAAIKPVEGASEAVNLRRERDGKKPIFEYRVLTLAPAEQIRAALGGTHASPRLHWRRGHLRTLPTERIVPVKPCLVGAVEHGCIVKDYAIAPASKVACNG